MVPPHLKNKALKDRADVHDVRDVAAPRTGGTQPRANPLPILDLPIPTSLTATAPLMVGPDRPSAPSTAPATSPYTEQELAAGRKRMRHTVEHPKDGEKGLSRQAAWRQFPILYVDVPRNEQGVPLPSPVLAGGDNDQITADTPDSRPSSFPHGASSAWSIESIASNPLPPPAFPLPEAQAPRPARAVTYSPTTSSNAATHGSRALSDADLPHDDAGTGGLSETLDLGNFSLQQTADALRSMAEKLLLAAQQAEELEKRLLAARQAEEFDEQ